MLKAVLVSFVFVSVAFGVHSAGQAMGQKPHAEAIEYVEGLSSEHRVLVWPNRLLFYEVNGDAPQDFRNLLMKTSQLVPGRLYFLSIGLPPTISFNFYRSSEGRANEVLQGHSRLPGYYLMDLAEKNPEADPCSFTVGNSRNTWASLAVAYVDLDRLVGEELFQCMEVALQYMLGFPLEASQSFRNVPGSMARKLILIGILTCSVQDENARYSSEISRDGIHALPSVDCIKEQIARLEADF